MSAPTPLQVEVWRQYKRLARASQREREALERTRSTVVVAGAIGMMAGALVAPLAMWVPTWPTWVGQVLAAISSVALALAAFQMRHVLLPERETVWARCRLVGEALKRESIRAMMKVPPYDGPDADLTLERKRVQLRKGVSGVHVVDELPADDQVPPAFTSAEAYLSLRARNQLDWYRTRAAQHRKSHQNATNRVLIVGGLGAVVGALSAFVAPAAALVPVLTSVAAAMAALVQRANEGALTSLYSATAEDLAAHVAMVEHKPPTDPAGIAAMVEGVEAILERENGSWQATFLDPKQIEEHHAALAAMVAPPEPTSPPQPTEEPRVPAAGDPPPPPPAD